MTPWTRTCQIAKWYSLFFYRKESLKTTWKFRLALLVLIIATASVTRGLWLPRIGQDLVCAEAMNHSDVLLIENFNASYFLFERAAALHKAGLAARVVVPMHSTWDYRETDFVSQSIIALMAQVAGIPTPEILPIRIVEPISLNTVYQIRDFLTTEHLHSVIVVTDGLRSKRSSLIYHKVLDPAGIQVGCVPVFGQTHPHNWMQTWHGVQDVISQFLKLQYYRFYVLWLRAS